MKTFWAAIVDGTRHALDIRGTMSRSHFWLFFLFLTLISVVVNTLIFLANPGMPAMTIFVGGLSPVAIIISVILLVPCATAIIRRLRDGGHSPWHVLWYLIPNLFGYAIIPLTTVAPGSVGVMTFMLLSTFLILTYLAGYLVLLVLLTLPPKRKQVAPYMPGT